MNQQDIKDLEKGITAVIKSREVVFDALYEDEVKLLESSFAYIVTYLSCLVKRSFTIMEKNKEI